MVPTRVLPLAVVLPTLVAVAGCSDDFAPYGFLAADQLRVLAIRAEPPELRAGESTTLDALVIPPTGGTPTYAWSWCPFNLGPAAGFECAVTEVEFNGLLAAQGFTTPQSFDLGNAPTATLGYDLPEVVVAGICASLTSAEVPDFVALPDCSRGLPITVFVDVRSGDQRVEAFKEVRLLTSAAEVPNTNPFLTEVAIATEPAESNAVESDAAPMPSGSPTSVELDGDYRLFVTIPALASDRFTPQPTELEPNPTEVQEGLVVTWFVTAGDIDPGRTLFNPENPDQQNRDILWNLPDPRDDDGGPEELILVIRDGRGGASWLRRDVQLEAAP